MKTEARLLVPLDFIGRRVQEEGKGIRLPAGLWSKRKKTSGQLCCVGPREMDRPARPREPERRARPKQERERIE